MRMRTHVYMYIHKHTQWSGVSYQQNFAHFSLPVSALSQETKQGSKETKTEPVSRVRAARVSTYQAGTQSFRGDGSLALYTLELLPWFAFSEAENKTLIWI